METKMNQIQAEKHTKQFKSKFKQEPRNFLAAKNKLHAIQSTKSMEI